MKQTKHSIKSHRYELVHGEDADFVAYQRKFGDGLWQTVSTWMIPRTDLSWNAIRRSCWPEPCGDRSTI
jgi:hypothetical protein